jgi:hypothetical protein
MLFKDYHVGLIKDRIKVQTRRIVNQKRNLKPWKIGSIHKIMTKYHKDGFNGYVLITSVRKEILGVISFRDAVREGYESVEEYKAAFQKIYGDADPELLVWVIDFVYLGNDVESICHQCEHHYKGIVRMSCDKCKFCYQLVENQRGTMNHFERGTVKNEVE